ncbi:MAG: PrsW family intramembrane metalloprotease [Spirochaetales bacterium]|nr:PrsW family intramembrane metalloprotease [Spirochaetales bacterium]
MIFLLVNILCAVVPALLLVFYFYRRDSQKKEPAMLIWKIFILGFFSVIPAVIIELFLEPFTALSNPLQSIFARAFIIAALVEEGIKLTVVRLFIYKRVEFDEITDGIIYTVTAAMGFACFENILFSTGGLSTILLRAVTAVPLHALASGIMGYYIGLSRFNKTGGMMKGLAIAVLIHGLYDFFLFTDTILGFLVIPILIISWIILKRLLDKALFLDRASGRS